MSGFTIIQMSGSTIIQKIARQGAEHPTTVNTMAATG
jgi:hypothetical protein